jgi:ATP-dependent helicase/nuclease subunit A
LLRPSDSDDDENRRGPRSGESERLRQLALQRGTLVHRLLQSLPDIASEKRHDTALNFLARNVPEWTDIDRVTLAMQVQALIDDSRLAALFMPGSRAEVAVAGRLMRVDGSLVLVSGQIDRLAVSKTEVRIVDYKTNHNPPRNLSAVPGAYVRQLALYRAVLAKLYPERPVRAALLWTEAIDMMEIPAPALDAELAAVISL